MATKTLKGKIGVTTENIFPVIKQFLYSDHEIFLRELVANAVDATRKLQALASSGDFKGELGEMKVRVELDEKKKILRIIDRGIGRTEDEVDRYINQIAFSSAGEFLEKYKDQLNSIIGHFGLGFYSAFMVSKKVTIDTLSWQEGAKAVHWSCDGSPEYEMSAGTKEDRGTEITLFLDDDAEEFAAKGRIGQLLGKYCKFMPVPVVFGKKTEWKDGKSVETDEDNVINNIEPIWTKAPSELKDEDYLKFYRELYPMEEEPMFWIHLNVDYPFTLTGVLYFPKIKERMAIDKNKIQLYCNQMFVTDHVDNIVPEFLTLLHGVIDSPDIPLNVSRSYLQSDANVKKISATPTSRRSAPTSPRRWPTAWRRFSRSSASSMSRSGTTSSSSSSTACSPTRSSASAPWASPCSRILTASISACPTTARPSSRSRPTRTRMWSISMPPSRSSSTAGSRGPRTRATTSC